MLQVPPLGRDELLRELDGFDGPSEPLLEVREGVPKTRADCANVPRPCPYVACRYNLWVIDSCDGPGKPRGDRRVVRTPIQPANLNTPSCALDVAELVAQDGGLSQRRIAKLLGISRRHVKRIITKGLVTLGGKPTGARSVCDPHRAQIVAWLAQGKTPAWIWRALRSQGFEGSKSALFTYVHLHCRQRRTKPGDE